MRITPEDVRWWYKRSGLSPLANNWFDGKDRACPLVARYAVATGQIPGREDAPDSLRLADLADAAFNSAVDCYGSPYIIGFVSGWDGKQPQYWTCLGPKSKPAQEHRRGYRDGRAVRAALARATR